MTSRGVATSAHGLARLDPAHQKQFDALTRVSAHRAGTLLGCNLSSIHKLEHGGTASKDLVARVTAALDVLKSPKDGGEKNGPEQAVAVHENGLNASGLRPCSIPQVNRAGGGAAAIAPPPAKYGQAERRS